MLSYIKFHVHFITSCSSFDIVTYHQQSGYALQDVPEFARGYLIWRIANDIPLKKKVINYSSKMPIICNYIFSYNWQFPVRWVEKTTPLCFLKITSSMYSFGVFDMASCINKKTNLSFLLFFFA